MSEPWEAPTPTPPLHYVHQSGRFWTAGLPGQRPTAGSKQPDPWRYTQGCAGRPRRACQSTGCPSTGYQVGCKRWEAHLRGPQQAQGVA